MLPTRPARVLYNIEFNVYKLNVDNRAGATVELVAHIQSVSTHDDVARFPTSYLTDGQACKIARWRSVALADSVVWDATVDAYCAVFSELGHLRRTRRG